MPAKIRHDSDRSQFQVVTPDGFEFDATDWTDGPALLTADGVAPHLVVLNESQPGVKAMTVYRLVALATTLDSAFPFDDEDDDDEDGGDGEGEGDGDDDDDDQDDVIPALG